MFKLNKLSLKNLLIDNWTIKSKLQALLMATSLGTLLLAGGISWYQREATIKSKVADQLTTLRLIKAEQLESVFENYYNQMWMLAEDGKVIRAMVELNGRFQRLDTNDVPSEWDKAIANYYSNDFLPQLKKNTGSQDLETNSFLPTLQAGRYLQYYYIADNPNPIGEKNKLLNPGDGSEYTKSHASSQKLFNGITEKLGYRDLYLINHKTGEIIYSVQKQVDFGTNVLQGYNARSGLAQLVQAIQANPTKGIIHVADFEQYDPSNGSPAMFLATPIYTGANMVGILAVQLSPDAINSIINKNNNWKAAGLGETGEVYVVGPDFLMRSNSRFFQEDPKKYQTRAAQQGTKQRTVQMSQNLNTTVALQKTQTPSTQAALGGEEGIQQNRNYLGAPVVSSYGPLKVRGVNWGIVAEMEIGEVYNPLYKLALTLLIGGVIFSLLSALLAALAARWLTQPLARFAESIQKVLAGETNTVVDIKSQNEFKELAVQFNKVLNKLRQNSEELQQQEKESNTLLENILPKTIAQRWKTRETHIADNIQQVTLVSARIVGIVEFSKDSTAQDSAELLTKIFDEFDLLAERYGLERQNTVGANYLAVCGLTQVKFDHVKRAVDFSLAMLDSIKTMADKYDSRLGLRIGVHTGAITAAVVGSHNFSYRIWGEPVYLVNTLQDIAELNYICVSQSLYEAVQEKFTFVKNRTINQDRLGNLETYTLISTNTLIASEVELVQSSFKKLSGKYEQVGALFYQRLFELEPSLRELFKGDIKAQQKKLMDTLGLAVQGLRKPENIIPTIQELGRRHAGYGVENQYYDIVTEALIWTLKQELGEDFTLPVQKAWEDSLEFLSSIMKEAAAESHSQTASL